MDKAPIQIRVSSRIMNLHLKANAPALDLSIHCSAIGECPVAVFLNADQEKLLLQFRTTQEYINAQIVKASYPVGKNLTFYTEALAELVELILKLENYGD